MVGGRVLLCARFGAGVLRNTAVAICDCGTRAAAGAGATCSTTGAR